MTLPPISADATLNNAPFRQAIGEMHRDLLSLVDVAKRMSTIKLSVELQGKNGLRDLEADIARTRRAVSAPMPINIGANGEGLRDVGRVLSDLQAQVKGVRNLWQTESLSNDEAAAAARRLRDELLQLAAARDTDAKATERALMAAAQAQRTMDQASGRATKGGFAFNASLGILDALQGMGGPAGTVAAQLGRFITDGLAGGMRAGEKKVAAEAEGLSQEIIDALKLKLQIHSPSVVMEEIGRFAVEGLIQGFKSGQAPLKAAAQELANVIPENVASNLLPGASDIGESPFIAGLATALEGIPEVFSKAFADAKPAAKEALDDLESEVELNVAPVFEGIASGFEKASAKLEALPASAAGAANALASVGDSSEEAAGGAAEVGDAAEDAGNGVEQLAGFLAVAAVGVTTFVAALSVAVPKAAEFETALKAISAESDLAEEDLAELGEGFLQVSDDLGISAIALAKAGYDIVGAGVKGAEANADLVKLTEVSARLAGAGMTDVKTAADTLTSALNAYGLSAANAEHVSDVLFQTTNVGKISLDQMGGSMNEVFPLAAKLGVSLEQLGGSVATLTAVGVPAEQAVTGIQAALDNIMRPSEDAKAAAKELGIGFDAATLKSKGLAKFLLDVGTAVQGNTALMGELFGSTEAINSVFALTSEVGAKKFAEALDKMAKAGGSTAEGYAEVADSFAHSQQAFNASVEAMQIEFASKFLPILTKASNSITDVVKNLDTLSQNGAVQFVAVTGGAVLLADVLMKVSAAAKAAATSTALFQAVSTAGGLKAYIAGLGGAAGAMNTLTGATLAGTAAAAPLAVVALAVGTAFASWKLGRLIGDLKLFGDETTTVNDKLTDFFATTLFGADPQEIKRMREQEEAQQRLALRTGQTADAENDVTAAIRAKAEAERQAMKAEQERAAEREAELQKIREQKAALTDLGKTLEDRKFKVSLEGKTELDKELAELGRAFDELREKTKKPFYTDSGTLQHTPGLDSNLKQLTEQQAAEVAAIRAKYAKQAVEQAKKDATEALSLTVASARARQQAELAAMQEGAAKRKTARAAEIAEINRQADEAINKLPDAPGSEKQAAQIQEDARRTLAAKRRSWAAEDEKIAQDNAKRLKDAEVAAQAAKIGAMEEGLAKQDALRRLALDRLRRAIDEQVKAETDPRLKADLRREGNEQIASLQQQQGRERAKEIEDAETKVLEAQRAARDAQIASMQEGRAKAEAERKAALDDLKRDIASRVKALKGDPARQAKVQESGKQQVASLERQQQQARLQEIRDGQKAVQEATRRGRDAEIAAMAEGAAKAEAQRQAELADLRADYAERIRLEKRPEVKAALQKEAKQVESAKVKEQARQRVEAQKQAQDQITAMERQTRNATIAAMREGVAKEEATRAAALADLRADLKKQVDELAGNPQQQARVMAEGNRLITATIAQQAEERRRAYQDAQRVVESVTRAARDAGVSAMQDSYAKEVLIRENALDDLVADLNRQANEFKGSEAQRAEFIRQANRQVLGLYQQQGRELREIQRAATQQVGEAERSARAAEIAGIRDETAKKRAARNEELRNLHRQTAETLRTFKGTAQQAQEIRDAARREQQAKQAGWNLEDEREARAAALRIARAWQEVSNKQFAAQQAARTAAQAGTELNFSRRIAAVSGVNDNPIERARLEAEAAQQRAAFNQQQADKQLAQDRANLVKTRDQALSAENLTAQDRKLIWQNYYADLAKLGSDYQAGNSQRLQQQEEAERQAAENMRQARIRAAEKPVEQSQTRQGELEQSRALATSDAELLAINAKISQERQTQLGALQAQLDGVGGVVLSAEEREKVEARVRSIQHDQAVSLKEQEQLQHDVTQSVFSRADAEAQLAEKLARTEADRVAAQQKQLAVAQLRKADLDRQILAEGREKERNALIEQRFGVLGQIAELQDKINGAPLEAEQRRLELYKAQAAAQLALQGKGDDEVAQAQLTVQIAAQELLLANQRVAAAQTELELQQALGGQAAARLALAQALQQKQVATANVQAEALNKSAEAASNEAAAIREALAAEDKRRQRAAEARAYELELLDIAQARAQAEARITGAAEDSVRSAELELQAARQRLDLLTQQSSRVERDPRAAADLLKEQVELLAQQAEAERKLAEARRQKRDLTEQLTESERHLMALLDPKSLDRESRATLQLTDAREGLIRAERNYLAVREQYRKTGSTADAEKLRAATDALTGSIRAQREAVTQLADAYVGIQDAAARIRAASGGEATFDVNLERRRLDAIDSRRQAAQKALREALAGGEAAQIQQAADALAQQEERWKKQADLMKSKGFQVSDAAGVESRRLARVLDELGIQRESEVGALQQRAAIAEKEALAAIRVQDAMTVFDKTTQELLDGLSQRSGQQQYFVNEARQDVLRRQASEDAAESLDKLAQALQKQAGSLTKAAAKPSTQTEGGLDQLAAELAKPVQDAVATVKLPPPAPAPAPSQWLLDYVRNISSPQVISQTVAQATEEALSHLTRMNVTYTPLDTPTTVPASHTINYHIEIGDTHITASNPADARRQFDGFWEGKMRELKQKKGWEPKRC